MCDVCACDVVLFLPVDSDILLLLLYIYMCASGFSLSGFYRKVMQAGTGTTTMEERQTQNGTSVQEPRRGINSPVGKEPRRGMGKCR